jgi:anti-anti-sigma factor
MSVTDGSSDFAVEATFDGMEAVLTLRGRVENLAAFDLGASLDATIDRHPTSVILDLTALTFMGAAAIVAVANAEQRLAEEGITLLVRSPSALVNRVLGLMESAEASRTERELPEHAALGPEESRGMVLPSQRLRRGGTADDLRRITAMPTEPDVVDGALRLVVELARSAVSGADGVSISLLRNGRLSTVAATDRTILAMDAEQYATGEGPCVDASIQGHWFHAQSMETETRWSAFTPKARALGIKAIMSSPLTALDQPVGALNIYSRNASTFEIRDQEAAGVFARQASMILSDARANVSDVQMAVRFQEALRSREVISLAKGVLMEREGIDEDAAFTALLLTSRSKGMAMRDRADEVARSSQSNRLRQGLPSDG